MTFGLQISNSSGNVTLDTAKIACSLHAIIDAPAGASATVAMPGLENERFFVIPVMAQPFPANVAPIDKTITLTQGASPSVGYSGGNYAAELVVLVF